MEKKPRLLLVEDDLDWLEIYCDMLRGEGYVIDTARSMRQAIEFLQQAFYDVVVTDLKMLGFGDEFGGFSVLQRTKELAPDTQVIVITGYGSRDIALRAMQQGAFDYVTKPPEANRFKLVVRAAVQASQLLSLGKQSVPRISIKPERRNSTAATYAVQQGYSVLPGFIANSQSMRVVYEQVIRAISSSFPVLIYGERGTGKSFIAETIHINSQRRCKPFSQVICGDLPFGFWKSVVKNLPQIQGGTLFLDDLTALNEVEQIALMELVPTIETYEIRVIASANVTKGREWINHAEASGIQGSLLHKIMQIPIWVPPLRERKDGDDISALIGYFLRKLAEEKVGPGFQITISSEAMRLLLEHDYRDGNIRELYRILENAVNLLGGPGTILPEHLVIRSSISMGETIKILFLSADPTNMSRLRLGEEFREIEEQLALSAQRKRLSLVLPRLSLRSRDIARALIETQPQIVHFSGHGTPEGALCFEDERGQAHLVQPEALAALFRQFRGQIKCVILSACYAESQAKAIAKHIDYVIGMNKAISDRAAIAFSIGFYMALGTGKTLAEAFEFGRIQIMLQGIPEHLAPVLIKRGETQPQDTNISLV